MLAIGLLTRLSLSLLVLVSLTGSARATSTGKRVPQSAESCKVTATFLNAIPENGKISWVFKPLKAKKTPACRALESTFKVVIPSGSYSELSQTNVYPVSITEPARGAETALKLVYFPTIGWLIAGEADSYKVLR